jgi:hypothetical protein
MAVLRCAALAVFGRPLPMPSVILRPLDFSQFDFLTCVGSINSQKTGDGVSGGASFDFEDF